MLLNARAPKNTMSTLIAPRYVSKMLDLVKGIDNLQKLFEMVIDLGVAPEMVKQILMFHVAGMNEDVARERYFACQSLDKIVSQDVLQTIAGFAHNADINRINRRFRKVYEKNISLVENNRQNVASLMKMASWNPPRIQTDDDLETFIPVTAPNSTEVIPKNLSEEFRSARSGDTIVLGPGFYIIEGSAFAQKILLKNKQLEMVGEGSGVFVYLRRGCIEIEGNSRVIFKNVHFKQLDSNHRAIFRVKNSSKLWMENCTARHARHRNSVQNDNNVCVLMSNKACLALSDCKIAGGQKAVEVRQGNPQQAVVDAFGCTFTSRKYALDLKGGVLNCGGCVFNQGGVKMYPQLQANLMGNLVRRCRHCRAQKKFEAKNKLKLLP